MFIEVLNLLTGSNPPEIKISHKGRDVSFSVASYGRTAFSKFNVFEYLNQYWYSLPENQQDDIFNDYCEISQAFNSIWSRVELTRSLIPLVSRMLSRYSESAVRDWIIVKSDVIIPYHFEDIYKESADKKGTRDQTYTKSDYSKLISLTLILHSVVPIWGEYITQTKKEIGLQFKEYFAYPLITKSSLVEWESFKKLELYVSLNTHIEDNINAKILAGISSEDYPLWMIANVVVHRLCLGDIKGSDPEANLVSYIFQYIKQKNDTKDFRSGEMIKEKDLTSSGESESEDDKLSVLETFRRKFNVSLGEIVEIRFSVSDNHKVAKYLEPNINLDFVDSCIATASKLRDITSLDPQVVLTQWIFATIVSPRAIPYLDAGQLSTLMGITQAVLWHRGFKYLSILSTCYPNLVEGELTMVKGDSRSRITKEIVAELDKYYPYMRAIGKKSDTKSQNEAINSIELLSEMFSSCSWLTTADDSLLGELFTNINSRRIPIVKDIKNIIAELVVSLNTK